MRPALLLLPGVAGHAGEFAALESALGGTYRVLALDPPVTFGIGIDEEAMWCAQQARSAGLGRFVVVGHSRGGIVALAMAGMGLSDVAGVVVLDAPVQIPPAVSRVLRLVLGTIPLPLWPPLLRRFFAATFVAADSPEWRAEVLGRLARIDRRVARRLTIDTFGYDAGQVLRGLRVPALYVRANIPTDLDRLPPTVRGAEVAGVGHWAHVHASAEVAALFQDVAVP